MLDHGLNLHQNIPLNCSLLYCRHVQNWDLKTLILCNKLAPLLCWGLPKGFYSLKQQSRNRDLLWELQPLATSSIITAGQSQSTGSYNKHDVTISLSSKAGVQLHGCKTLSDENCYWPYQSHRNIIRERTRAFCQVDSYKKNLAGCLRPCPYGLLNRHFKKAKHSTAYPLVKAWSFEGIELALFFLSLSTAWQPIWRTCSVWSVLPVCASTKYFKTCIAARLVLESQKSTMCSSRPIQLSVGSVGVHLTDCGPRSAVKITALSVKQVEPRWTHGRLQTDHRFCPAVSCHHQLKRYLQFFHVLIRNLLLQNCLKPLGILIISFCVFSSSEPFFSDFPPDKSQLIHSLVT